MIEDDHSLMGGVIIHSHGGFEQFVVDRLVLCYGFLLTYNVNSLIYPLDVGICKL